MYIHSPSRKEEFLSAKSETPLERKTMETVERNQRKVQQKEAELKLKELDLQGREHALIEKEELLATKERMLTKREFELEKLELDLKERFFELHQDQARVKELQAKSAHIEKKKQEIDELENRLRQKVASLEGRIQRYSEKKRNVKETASMLKSREASLLTWAETLRNKEQLLADISSSTPERPARPMSSPVSHQPALPDTSVNSSTHGFYDDEPQDTKSPNHAYEAGQAYEAGKYDQQIKLQAFSNDHSESIDSILEILKERQKREEDQTKILAKYVLELTKRDNQFESNVLKEQAESTDHSIKTPEHSRYQRTTAELITPATKTTSRPMSAPSSSSLRSSGQVPTFEAKLRPDLQGAYWSRFELGKNTADSLVGPDILFPTAIRNNDAHAYLGTHKFRSISTLPASSPVSSGGRASPASVSSFGSFYTSPQRVV